MNYLLKFDSDVLFDIEKHKKAGNKQILKKINQLCEVNVVDVTRHLRRRFQR